MNNHISSMKILTIDVFGTLFVPRPSVPAQYLRIVQQHEKCSATVAQVQAGFHKAFKRLFKEYPLYGKETIGYEQWWCLVIRETFENKISLQTAHHVYDHFGTTKPYHLYEDAIPLLTKVRAMGFRTAALSNMDPRVIDVLHDLGLTQYLDETILSFDTEVEKPDIRAWKNVENTFGVTHKDSDGDNLLYHVGDERKKDLVSVPGWVTILVDRSEGFQEFHEFEENQAVELKKDILKVSDDQFVVKSLVDVVELLE